VSSSLICMPPSWLCWLPEKRTTNHSFFRILNPGSGRVSYFGYAAAMLFKR
jgi:hypothetical protein